MSPLVIYLAKAAVSAIVIVAVSEIAKRSTGFAALIASLPLTSLLAFVWLHLEGTPGARIGELSIQVFWLVIPSLVFFVLLTWLLNRQVNFWPSLALAVLATAASYGLMLWLLRRIGIAS